MDALVQQSFMEIQTMNSICCSRNLKDDDDFVKEKLLSFFSLVKKQYHSFLTSEQMKEVDITIHSLSFEKMKTTEDKSITLRNFKGCFPSSMPLWLSTSVERKETALLNNEKCSRTNALLINPKKHKASNKPLLNEHVSKRPKSEILEPKAVSQSMDVKVNAKNSNEASSKVLQIQWQKYSDSNHDMGKIQLKPRDPRRILFEDNIQKSSNSLHQLTSNVIDTKVFASSLSKLCGNGNEQDKKREIEEQNKLFASHKLCLVLDLDHTLLNSIKFEDLDPIYNEKMREIEKKEQEKPQQQNLFCLEHMHLWTKLRPGVRNFLEKASELYELYIYTMGTKSYAEEMAKILDPTGMLFAGRIISRENNKDLNKDLNKVSRMVSSVLIIDDTIEVWPQNKPNVIVVERYIYFPNSQCKSRHLKSSLFEVGHDERADIGTLASILKVIVRVHQNFSSHSPFIGTDVRNILALEQQKILSGCKILFSHIFPMGETNPQEHPLWQTCEKFGAICTNQIDEEITHVVTNSLGTEKVKWALSTGKFVVNPGWIKASAFLYNRANEKQFIVKD